MNIETLLSSPPYELNQTEKEPILLDQLIKLDEYHKIHCAMYKNILSHLDRNLNQYPTLKDIPYLPVNIFKELVLTSIPKDDVFKTLNSSGTTSSVPSVITLDRATSQNQTAALSSIMQSYLGNKRLPMLIIDTQNVLKDPKKFSARGAGIIGMSQFGYDHFYALDDHMKIDKNGLEKWLKKHESNQIFIFGFTYLFWEYFIKGTSQGEYDLSNAILFHGGGWKKIKQEVTPLQFKESLIKHFNLNRSHSFYGMVEQTGSIFVECEKGYLHCPSFADVIVRNPISWQPVAHGELGVIQALSLLPKSYPGHSLLTEDIGYIKGCDTCPCGRKGKFFWVEGRVPKAEPRGCGDTFAIHDENNPQYFAKLEDQHLINRLSGSFNIPNNLCEHKPFEPLLLDFCRELSKKLSIHADPDLAALGFWLRPAQLIELKEHFEKLNTPTVIRVPQGLVFQITASNVDTLFVYSWILSLLTGNNNIIRLPSKTSVAIDYIIEIINTLFQDPKYSSIANSNSFIRYAPQKNITELFSSKANVRIIWGSNATINEIRTIPISPYTKEIIFPDRISYAVLSSESFIKLPNDQKKYLVQSFFRDAYGFDQHGCSSPRYIFWIGSKEDTALASIEFYELLQKEIQRRNYQLPLSDFLQKQTAIYVLCAKYPLVCLKQISNELSIIEMNELPDQLNVHHGGGLFYHISLSSLQNLSQHTALHDQTLTYFGLSKNELELLIHDFKGINPTRILPIGEALNFNSIWDGQDLLQEMTRCIEVHYPKK